MASLLLVFPTCWNDDLAQDLKKEILSAERLLASEQYTLKYVLEFMKSYLSEDDKQSFFSNLQSKDMQSDCMGRLAFHLAMRTDKRHIVLSVFVYILQYSTYDEFRFSY